MICGNFIKSETSEKLHFPYISTFLVAISVEHLFFTDFYRKQDNSAVIFLHRVGKNISHKCFDEKKWFAVLFREWKIVQFNLKISTVCLLHIQVSDDEDDEISHDSEEEERELEIKENMSTLQEAVASLGVK